ncbi:EthD domain-containing protein [Thauera humireducens]|jgi:hypothetical protein|uniref:EthD domain-containing protein n=1 Tax=Thauera humireducens TaxID=1134435 RepID=UPI002467A27C|nr:EthD domain-containing protein [Thauera humireducens]CAH1749310.1 EthD domain-containing protein [Thauera humireducens]
MHMEERWKMIYLARRNPALAPEDFPQAWREHSALGRECRNVQDKVLGVRQCSRVLDRPGVPQGASAEYDGVNLLSLRDRQAADDIWSDDETLRIMRPDEPRVFSTYVRDFTLVASETVLVDGEETGVCVVLFLRGRAGGVKSLSRADIEPGSPWAAAARLVWNTVSGECPPGYEYDAIVEAWFASADVIAEAFGSGSVWAQLPGQLTGEVDGARSVCVLTHVTHRRP